METIKVNKVLLYGGSNIITDLLLKELKAQNIQGETSNITTNDDIYIEIINYEPTHIIYYRDYEDNENSIQIELNLIEPLVLLQYCNKLDIHMTYIGTGYIYKSDKNTNYFSEKIDANNFDNSYFIAKSSIDKVLKIYYDVVLNIRIKLPIYFNNSPQDFLDVLLENNEITGIPNSITILNDFIPQIVGWVMEYRVGTINAVNSGYITKYDIKTLYDTYTISKRCINNIIVNKKNVLNLPEDSIDIKSRLDIGKLYSWWNKCPHINRSITQLFTDYQKKNIKI